jgi:hypothetical protein
MHLWAFVFKGFLAVERVGWGDTEMINETVYKTTFQRSQFRLDMALSIDGQISSKLLPLSR